MKQKMIFCMSHFQFELIIGWHEWVKINECVDFPMEGVTMGTCDKNISKQRKQTHPGIKSYKYTHCSLPYS